MFPVFNLEAESRMTMKVIHEQEQDLNRMLIKVSKKRDYLSKKSSDQISGVYNDYFDELSSIQEKCRTAYMNINYSNQNLTKCKERVVEINKVLMETKKIINDKFIGTLQSRTRTHILDNRPYFSKDIDYKKKDRYKKSDTKNQTEAKRLRRQTNYPMRDIMDIADDEDPGNYDDYTDDEDEEYNYTGVYVPEDDPLFGTHTFPQHLMEGGKTKKKKTKKLKQRKSKTKRR